MGLLIRGENSTDWFRAIQRLTLKLDGAAVFPIPNASTGTLWGCLLSCAEAIKPQDAGPYELCQCIANQVFIPEKSTLHPTFLDREFSMLFGNRLHVFHGDFGLVELNAPLDLKEILAQPRAIKMAAIKPEMPDFVPNRLRVFSIAPLSATAILERMEKEYFPAKESLNMAPLTFFEKIRLFIYRLIFPKGAEKRPPLPGEKRTLKDRFLEKMERWLQINPAWLEKIQLDLQALELRNQKEVDRLLDLLTKNPNEALKYAIPIDDSGMPRGIRHGRFKLFQRWSDFGLDGPASRSSGISIPLGDKTDTLRMKYFQTAKKLIEENEFQKAAFVYLKLLGIPHMAADTLEKGGLYREAAVIYQNQVKNKAKAAECFENGGMYAEAIALYEELMKFEKIGDLYLLQKNREKANLYYQKEVSIFVSNAQYVKAALLLKNKVLDLDQAQALLLKGWKTDKDAQNCLQLYFANIEAQAPLKTAISEVINAEMEFHQRPICLRVMAQINKKHPEISDFVQDQAYSMVATNAEQQPELIDLLSAFNVQDAELRRDIFRFKANKQAENRINSALISIPKTN